jgi:prevent-host-death family protein
LWVGHFLFRFIDRFLDREEVIMDSREVIENMVSITELSQKSSQIVAKVEKGDIQYIAKRNKVVAAIVDMEFLLLLEDACRDWKRIEAEGEFPDPWEYAKVVKMVRQLDRGELELVDYEDFKKQFPEVFGS